MFRLISLLSSRYVWIGVAVVAVTSTLSSLKPFFELLAEIGKTALQFIKDTWATPTGRAVLLICTVLGCLWLSYQFGKLDGQQSLKLETEKKIETALKARCTGKLKPATKGLFDDIKLPFPFNQ